jgi:muramoyltetrapeptide carboxypeptidase
MLDAGVAILAERYRVRVPDGVYAQAGYLAGDDDRRLDELCAALADPAVRALFCARGGYGVLRIIDRLDPALLHADPKPIVGFSDLTALHAWALAAGVRSVHGPVVERIAELDGAGRSWLFDLLESPAPAGTLPGCFQPIGAEARSAREGVLVGGNLTLIAHLVGTPWQLPLDGAICLIEDVDERPFALDRYLTRLGLAGALRGCQGVLVGGLTRCEPPPGRGPSAAATVDERLRHFGLPGLSGLPVGHLPHNLALPHGAACRLDPVACTLELLEPAVG